MSLTPRSAAPCLACALLLLAGCADAEEHTISAGFTCEGGKKIAAVFANGAHASVKLTLSDGRQLTLPQVLSASGARYANADESIVLWNKGRSAFIEEGGKRTYSQCQQSP